ncbi:MAG: RimK/LysX family protein [Gammaproteobacteria bacterium]|nr:RimK/LysX family protein [Gammaproteobacteria bacterium]
MKTKIVCGYVEKATLVEKNLTLSAKLDTGAKSASLSAIKIKKHTNKDGKVYLSFDIPTKVGLIPFQAEFVGKVRIKPRVDEHHTSKPTLPHSIHRPMVIIKLKLGDNIQEIRVNLTNRKRFLYPLLLGRDAIVAFNGIIDPGHAFLLKNK